MINIKNVPEIRFKGCYDKDGNWVAFTHPWEQRKLPEFVSFFNGLTYTPDDVEETGTLVLRSSNVKNGEIVDADNVYVNDKVAVSENVREGDIIVVVRNGSRALIGKHAQIKASMPNTVIGAFMSGMRSEHSSFVNALLDTSAFENEIAKNMGATINQITGYMFSKMEFMIPSGDEQRKIGDYFRNLDNLITLHQRKADTYKKLKKCMLQKMFPKDGEIVPERRFPKFTEPWKKHKFGDVVHIRRGLTYRPTDVEENGIRVLRSSNINENTFVYGNDDIFVNPNAVNIETVRENDILITSANGSSRLIGKHTLIKEIPDNSAVHGGFMLLGRTENYDFVNASMSSSWYTKFINVFVAGGNGAIGNLNKNDLGGQVILFPNDDEQIKVGKYFSTLDNLINITQQKVDIYKKLKKCMLQKMFV